MSFHLRAIVLLLTVSLIAGCTRQPAERKLEVEAFIVTRGSESIKLGLLEVKAVPLEAAKKAFTSVVAGRNAASEKADADGAAARSNYESVRGKLEGDLAAANARVPQTKERASQAVARYRQAAQKASDAALAYQDTVLDQKKMTMSDPRFIKFRSDLGAADLRFVAGFGNEWFGPDIDTTGEDAAKAIEIVSRTPWEGLPEQRAAVLEVANQVKAAIGEATQAIADQERIEKEAHKAKLEGRGPPLTKERPEDFYNVLPFSGKSAKTNADGRCTLSLPEGQWIVAASTRRLMASGEQEDYVWIVRLEAKDDHLTLSNDNLLRQTWEPDEL